MLYYLFLLVISFTCNAKPDKFYQPFNLTHDDIQTIVNNTISVPSSLSDHADISFLAADIKYNNGVLKFCEMGDGIYMTHLRDINLEINGKIKTINSPPWVVVWHYLNQCGLPIWFIGPAGGDHKTLGMNKHLLALDELKKLGGQYISGLDGLEKNPVFLRAIKKDFKKTNCLKDHRGIIIYCAESGEQNSQAIKAFKQQYPGFIFVNDTLASVVARKDSTYKLFTDSGLSDYIPFSQIYDKSYSQHLIQNILRDFSSDYLVLKPVAWSASRGVSIIHKDTLDSVLSVILNSDTKTLQKNSIPWLADWAYDSADNFMISEYASSKILIRDGKPYDPTMRIQLLLRHDQGNMYVTLIGGYWKIPGSSLDDQVSLTEKHVTRSHLRLYGQDPLNRGILVEKEDLDSVRTILNRCLPILYKHILLTTP